MTMARSHSESVRQSSPKRFSLRATLMYIAMCAVTIAILRALPRAASQSLVLCLPAFAIIGVWAICRRNRLLILVGMIGVLFGLLLAPQTTSRSQIGYAWSDILSFNGQLIIASSCIGVAVVLVVTELLFLTAGR